MENRGFWIGMELLKPEIIPLTGKFSIAVESSYGGVNSQSKITIIDEF
jgi:hypothetical protein